MSITINPLASLIQSNGVARASTNGPAQTTGTADFAASLKLSVANLQAETLTSLIGSLDGSSGTDSLGLQTSSSGTSTSLADALAQISNTGTTQGLSPTGRNLALFDPESAYKMMTVINNEDVTYKAQFSELSSMGTEVKSLQTAGQTLSSVSTSSTNADITTQLQAFTTQYNNWITQFGSTTASGGVLAGTQAAEVSLSELDQSVENRFNGAADGIQGMSDLGLSIDPNTKLASLDTSKLDAVLTSNKTGVIDTLQQFSANFTKSAELLNSTNNFIPNQLDNLDSAIQYIANNESALQSEFGTGDAATPSDVVKKALAAYNQSVKT
jgi:hypothetical protein